MGACWRQPSPCCPTKVGLAARQVLLLGGVAWLAAAPPQAAARNPVRRVECDVTVAGGSTASLAAALTAAESAPSLRVCFTEITDWPGGQLTAGGVPAIDFGQLNRFPENQPRSFQSFVRAVRNKTDKTEFGWKGNRGACSVSTTCFQPADAVVSWMVPRLLAAANLHVFLRTAIVSAERDAASGSVQLLRAVQRTPREPEKEWTKPLSQEISDWYSSADSAFFTKQMIELRSVVYVEATELADVLLSAQPRLQWAQGVEVPTEASNTTDSTCGQASTITFYMELLATRESKAHRANDSWPAGDSFCFGDCATNFSSSWARGWEYDWTYRRAQVGPGGKHATRVTNVGDITQINYQNDLYSSSLFLPEKDVVAQATSGWRGGLNLTTLELLERRAWGTYQFLVRSAPNSSWSPRLAINATVAGTRHGLSKFVYLRETRRAVGLNGFRLRYDPAFLFVNKSNPRAAYRFGDTVAMGDFLDDVHKLQSSDGYRKCDWPAAYTAADGWPHPMKAFYVPFRALTVDGSPNLLVAGKTMAQTFHANAATRLHPCEWHSGVAAGAAAVLMVQRNLTTASLAANVSMLQALLNSSLIGAPLEFDPAPAGSNLPPLSAPDMYGCAFERCVGYDNHTAASLRASVSTSASCNATCRALRHDEWLANCEGGAIWRRDGNEIIAVEATTLKKSFANSLVLPATEKHAVGPGTRCKLVVTTVLAGYMLCQYDALTRALLKTDDRGNDGNMIRLAVV